MTDSAGTPPTEPVPGSQAPNPPPAAAWQAPTPAAPVPGTPGFVYADVPNRVIALIIDSIILGIITAVVTSLLYGIVGQPFTLNLNNISAIDVNYLPLLVGLVVGLVISAVYWVYSWSTMRASIGMKVLGMQIGSAPNGGTLTTEQALRRWAVLFAPFSLSQIVVGLPLLGAIIGLLSLLYAIYLLYTTYQSPTKQGFHDRFANTMVVKATRTA